VQLHDAYMFTVICMAYTKYRLTPVEPKILFLLHLGYMHIELGTLSKSMHHGLLHVSMPGKWQDVDAQVHRV
jgi:hypothetical protein